jgi:hypothetical protein
MTRAFRFLAIAAAGISLMSCGEPTSPGSTLSTEADPALIDLLRGRTWAGGIGAVDPSSHWPGADPSPVVFEVGLDRNGAARGTLWSRFVGGEEVWMDLTCLSTNGNEAWIGGTVVRSEPSGLYLSDVFVIRFQDNGLGRHAPPDRMSFFRAGGIAGPDRCLNQPDPPNGEFDLHFPFVYGGVLIR